MKKIVLILLLLICSVSIVGACENNTTTIMVDENNITYPTIDEDEIMNNNTSFVNREVVENLTIEPELNETNVAVYTGIEDVNDTGDSEVVGELATGNPFLCLIVIFFILLNMYRSN